MCTHMVPLLKEYRIERILQCLQCIDRYPYNRDAQKECVLEIYRKNSLDPSRISDKAVFRGMVIPTLRYLGLIRGYRDLISLSSNGKLIVESRLINQDLYCRTLCAIIVEQDNKYFHFIRAIKELTSITPMATKKEVTAKLSNIVEGSFRKQKKERIRKWLNILHEVGLAERASNGSFTANNEKYDQAKRDLDPTRLNHLFFKKCLYQSYFLLSRDSGGIVDIADLRQTVAIKYLKCQNEILTEYQFDKLLEQVPLDDGTHLISLGKPMGKGEKLFKYKDDHFKTIYIKKIKRK